MVHNEPDATRCVACEAAKPGAKPKGGRDFTIFSSQKVLLCSVAVQFLSDGLHRDLEYCVASGFAGLKAISI